MRTTSGSRLLHRLWATALVAMLLGLACTPTRSDPFEFGQRQRAKESETSVVESTPTPNPEEYDAGTMLENIPSKGEIKLVNWQVKGISLCNNLAGYIIAHGYLFNVTLVDMTPEEYQEALVQGQTDAILALPRSDLSDWYAAGIESGAIKDVGSLFEGNPDLRIVVNPSLKERAPEVVEFLSKVKPGDEKLSELESQISLTGRVAVTPTVGALRYLKANQDVWTQWVPEDVAKNVNTAIEGGKSSLKRRCYRSRESSVTVCE